MDDGALTGYVMNERTGTVHLDGDAGVLACGKPLPLKAAFLTAWPEHAAPRCRSCFGL
jgi:hypothetical protein